MSSCWTRIILSAYINPRGSLLKVFQEVSRIQENFRFLPLSVMRERSSYNSYIFFPVDVDTLSNHVKSCVLWLYGDLVFNCLLVVYLQRFCFHCLVFNSVVLYYLIGDRSSTDRSFKYPLGNIENVLMKVDKFYFPTDFIVLDMEEDSNVLLILRRPFLATGKALIDVEKGKLILRVQDEEVTFNVFKAMKNPFEVAVCLKITSIDKEETKTVEEGQLKSSQVDFIQLKSTKMKKEKIKKMWMLRERCTAKATMERNSKAGMRHMEDKAF